MLPHLTFYIRTVRRGMPYTCPGVEPYAKAIATLFDPAASRADLISIRAEGPSR